jgi:cytosine deaminase
MNAGPELVVRDGYLADRDAVMDVAVADGRITAIEERIDERAPTELDAGGDLVSPGLVDAHVHLDMSLSSTGDRLPRNNDGRSGMDDVLEKTADYFAGTDSEHLESNVRTVGRRAVANGVLHLRTHGYVDAAVGSGVVEAVLAAREALSDYLDIEVVAFPQQGVRRDEGSAAAVRAALEAGADLVGGLDPAALNGDREATLSTWFDTATEHDVGLDVHVHERDETGLRTLERLAAMAADNGYEGRVTASHAFALADAAGESRARDDRLATAIERFEAASMGFVTCYQSTPEEMPIRRCHEAGVGLAHGTDQVHDLWGAHGNVDALEAMLVESLRLDSYSTNEGLGYLWNLVTSQGANRLGLDGYGVDVGTAADLVVHDAASPQWAILRNRTPRYCLKDGAVVARDGEFVAGE